MGFIRRQLLKVIKWDDPTKDTIVYRYPMEDRDEIMNGCQLIVQESQVALLVSTGQIADVYGPGDHKLTTNNMPILTKLASWKYGFDSPFKADVYFVNTKQFINMKWGTSSKIPMRDDYFGLVRIGARGTYSFQVSDAALFMREVFGTIKRYSTADLVEYFKSIIVSNFTNVIGEAKISALDIPAKYIEIGDLVKDEIQDDFDKIGLTACAFYVESVVLPEVVEEAIDKRASTGAMQGAIDDYTRLQTADAIRDAAQNEGGGLAAAGVGIAAGAAIGQSMVNNLNNNQILQTAAPTGKVCPSCNTQLPDNAKFCPGCGKPVAQKNFCINCGHQVPDNAKFCPECGKQI
ncbi:MAG: SPFH domain-containing protein [Bacilli bacterium]|nr:SPFH domain-containing protein [Bacilli bacterium]